MGLPFFTTTNQRNRETVQGQGIDPGGAEKVLLGIKKHHS
jgi:hypothetical protein